MAVALSLMPVYKPIVMLQMEKKRIPFPAGLDMVREEFTALMNFIFVICMTLDKFKKMRIIYQEFKTFILLQLRLLSILHLLGTANFSVFSYFICRLLKSVGCPNGYRNTKIAQSLWLRITCQFSFHAFAYSLELTHA